MTVNIKNKVYPKLLDKLHLNTPDEEFKSCYPYQTLLGEDKKVYHFISDNSRRVNINLNRQEEIELLDEIRV